MPDYAFLGKYVITADLKTLTGLHIGGSDTDLEIGGTDNPVIKNPATGAPYVPGSSLKGKLRALLEWLESGHNVQQPHPEHDHYGPSWEPDHPASRLFGVSTSDDEAREEAGPTRVTVRDAFLTNASRADLKDRLDGLLTSVKSENFLDRVTAAATPRKMERVPAGAVFGAEIVVDRYEGDDPALVRQLFAALNLLENDTLGGGGSRGNGKVRFENARVAWRGSDDFYLGGQEEEEIIDSTDLSWSSGDRKGAFAGHKISGRAEGQYVTSESASHASIWSILSKDEVFEKAFAGSSAPASAA
jgi:CRISPR-associated protein Csm3